MRFRKSRILIFLITALTAFASFFLTYENEKDKFHLNFQNFARRVNITAIKELKSLTKLSNAFKAHLNSSSANLDKDSFQIFSETLLESENSVVAMQWLEYTPAKNRKEFEFKLAKEHKGYKIREFNVDGSLKPAANRDKHFPVVYNFSPNEHFHQYGFDWNSLTNRSNALQNAIKYGVEFSFLGNLEKFSTAPNVIVVPVYRYNSISKNIYDRLQGFIVSFVDIRLELDKELKEIIRNSAGLIIFEIIEDDNEQMYVPIYSYDDTLIDELELESVEARFKLNSQDKFKWAGKEYLVFCYPNKNYVDSINYIPAILTAILILILGFFLDRFFVLIQIQKLEVERKVLKRTAELKRSNEELVNFANIVSHDLKEPIRGIANYALFLSRQYSSVLDEKGQKMLATIQKLAKKSIDLSSSLLEYSRVDKIDFVMNQIDLQEKLDDVLFTLGDFLDQNNVVVSVDKQLPTIECDKIKVGEIFRNLITNAVKYNTKDQKEIVISYSYSKDGVPIFVLKIMVKV